jgi:hypothetical protein
VRDDVSSTARGRPVPNSSRLGVEGSPGVKISGHRVAGSRVARRSREIYEDRLVQSHDCLAPEVCFLLILQQPPLLFVFCRFRESCGPFASLIYSTTKGCAYFILVLPSFFLTKCTPLQYCRLRPLLPSSRDIARFSPPWVTPDPRHRLASKVRYMKRKSPRDPVRILGFKAQHEAASQREGGEAAARHARYIGCGSWGTTTLTQA